MSDSKRKFNHAAWIGPLVAVVGFLSYFTIAVRHPDLRDSAVVNLTLVFGGVVIAGWGLLRRRNWKSWIGFGSAGAVAFMFGTYIFAVSNQLPPPDTAPAVGSAAPTLELPDLSGRTMSLDDLRFERVLVVFYRGYW